jgi:O-antigen ligase
MKRSSPQQAPDLPSQQDRVAAFCERALPVVLSVLFFTTAFAKVAASVAHSLSILLFLLHRYLTRTPLNGGRTGIYYALLGAYCGVMLLSFINTENLPHGIQLFRTILWKLMIVIVVVETVRSAAEVRRALLLYAAGCTVLAFIAIYEGSVLQVVRPPSMWIAVHGGNLLMFGLIAMIALLFHGARRYERGLLSVMIVLSAYALYLNGTRGAWIAMACVTFLVPALVPRTSWKRTVVAYAVLLLAAVLMTLTPFVQNKYRDTIDSLDSYQHDQRSTSIGWRIDMWKASLSMFREQPLLGVGLGDWQHDLGLLIDAGKASPTVRHYGQTHNMFLDAMSTQGTVGLLALLAIMFYPVRIVWKHAARSGPLARTLLFCTTTATVLSGMTDTLIHIRGVFLSYLMFVGLSLALVVREERAEHRDSDEGHAAIGNR